MIPANIQAILAGKVSLAAVTMVVAPMDKRPVFDKPISTRAVIDDMDEIESHDMGLCDTSDSEGHSFHTMDMFHLEH